MHFNHIYAHNSVKIGYRYQTTSLFCSPYTDRETGRLIDNHTNTCIYVADRFVFDAKLSSMP